MSLPTTDPAPPAGDGSAVPTAVDAEGADAAAYRASVRKARLAEARTLIDVPERLRYRIKRRLLGPPLVTEQLHEEKLSKKSALGILSSDCISSSAYGTEEMLLVLLGVFGMAGFHILMPLTFVVLGVLILMTLSYREVVMIYTRAGGSYVVARDNFGPKVAQIASVALLIDYIVTVAVQAAAGVAAVLSIAPKSWQGKDIALALTVVIVLLLAYGNLRGIREAGRAFSFPTYLFVAAAGSVVVVGVIRELFGTLPTYHHEAGMIPIHDKGHAILSAVAIFYLLRAFANGGSSLTGLEAISNGVSAFKAPAGRNARRTLSIMSMLLGSLVLGISFLAWRTHATPYEHGIPTVISQVADAVFGQSWFGNGAHIVVQFATALILITGANTPFTGFPFLASFIAEDSFLPRQLTRRGHRLAFSNGIVVLTVCALALLIGVGANVDNLVPFYAIGVFTGFTMAGLGMARYHTTHHESGWRRKFVINLSGGIVSALVVVIFAVVKFTEGAWLVVLLFPLGWLVLMRLNRRYMNEARSLDLASWIRKDQAEAPHYSRHSVLVLVDRLDLAVLRALRYSGSLRPTDVTAVHLMIDDQVAAQLQRDWVRYKLGDRVPLEIVECPDRRLVRAAGQLALDTVIEDRAEVTVLLPRRTFRRVSQRLLHDRTADRIAEAVGRIPHVAATIVPFDTTLPHEAVQRIEAAQRAQAEKAALPAHRPLETTTAAEQDLEDLGPRDDGTTPIGAAVWRENVTVSGRIRSVRVGTTAGRSLEVELCDDTGGLRLLFFGRTRIPGLEPGTTLRASGRVGEYKGHLALANPRYELTSPS